MNLQLEVRSNLLETLPGLAHFQDRLAMEHRRASRAEQPFSLVVVGVKPSPALGTPSKATLTTMFGETAKALIRRLRGDDSIYHFGRGVFGILLPRVHTSIANLIAENLRKDLREVIGADLGSFEMQIISFPDDAASAREEEGAVVNFLSDKEMDSALDGAVRTRNSLLRDRLRAAACNYPANSSRVLTL